MSSTAEKRSTSERPRLAEMAMVAQARRWTLLGLLQVGIAVLLAISLGFIVISNAFGWSARMQVVSVERRCAEGICYQAVVLAGSKRTFRVPENVRVAPGSFADVSGRCTPRCDLEIAGVQANDEFDLLRSIYSRVFVPGLPVIATIQNTLTGLVHVAWLPVIAQMLFPAVRRRPKILSYEFWLDLIYVLQTQLLYMTALGAAIGVSTGWLQAHTPVLFPGLAQWPLWIQVVLAVWVYDFVVYWRHRLEHQLFFLWPIHAVHHTTKQVDVFTTTRLHFLELMAGGILNLWVTARFGIGEQAAGIGFMLYLNYNYYVHTNVKIVHPGFLKYVFVSPFMHRWHHASEEQAVDKNFGVIFAWNDWLFGTALHPDREPNGYGIAYAPGEVARDSYLAHQFYPLQVLCVRLFRRGSALLRRLRLPASA